jgi:hypothetical protein
MKQLMILTAVSGLCLGTTGCGTAWFAPPDQYATAPYAWAHNSSVHHNSYDPVIRDSDEIRYRFVEILVNDCRDAIIDAKKAVESKTADTDTNIITNVADSDGKLPASTNNPDCRGTSLTDPTAYACWVRQHRAASMCADAIALHAVNQCVAKSGGQNAFSAEANIGLGTVLSAGGLAADLAALASHGSNATVAVATSSAVTSSTNNVKTFAPATVTSKVVDFVSAEQSYVALARFTDAELAALYDLAVERRAKRTPLVG